MNRRRHSRYASRRRCSPTISRRQHEQKLGPADAASPEWIPLFLGEQCDEKNRGLSAGYFRAKLKAGACHVLIDGLDETPDELSRERLAKLIHEAAAAFDTAGSW